MTATLPTDETVADRLEFEIRQAMSRLPKPETYRGWLSGRARRDGLEWLDALFDEFNDLTKP